MALSAEAKRALRTIQPPVDSGEAKEVSDAIDQSWKIQTGNPQATKIAANADTTINGTTASISTGLSVVIGFTAMQVIDTAPTTTTMTWGASGGTVTLSFWGPTGAGNTALTAKTLTGTISWVAWGY